MRCSVVILNWNGAKMLQRYLPSVVQHTPCDLAEVVVADNGSTDDSIAVVERFPSVRLIKFDSNYGFAGGYNRALEHLQTEYTVLLNSDVEVTSEWLDPLVEYLDNHPDVAACQPKIRSDLQRDKFEYAGAAGGMIDSLGYPFCRGRILGEVETDTGQYDSNKEVFWASGACLCIRTDVYKQAGGLDADFFAHMEEIDLCWRLQCRGMKVVCIPQSTVYHLGGGSLNYESPRKTYLNFRNNLLMLYKNLPDNDLNRVLRWRWCLDYLAALHLLLSGKHKNAMAVLKARRDFSKMRYDTQFVEKRTENMKNTAVAVPDVIFPRSILKEYYFSRKRKFSQLSY